jgi:hypothetical protein
VEQRSVRRLWGAASSVLLIAMLGASGVVLHSRGAPTPLLASVTGRTEVRAPAGVRVRVQVLNTTKTHGLARRATQLLRDRGFDVVELGTVGPAMDTTVVLDLSGHPAWAEAVAKVMAPAHTRARRDSSRYLDVTVLVGSSWRPPAEPLYP